MRILLTVAILVLFGWMMSKALVGLGDQDPSMLHRTDVNTLPLVR